jgi:hypothetical protein
MVLSAETGYASRSLDCVSPVGFGVLRGIVDGVTLCQMFNRATRRQSPPTYLSSDHDPLYRFHQWQANLRILDVNAIKTVPMPNQKVSDRHGDGTRHRQLTQRQLRRVREKAPAA